LLTFSAAHWPSDPATRESILKDFKKPWGDRRQEIVMIGEKLDKKSVEAEFNQCLLTPQEMKRWEKIMRAKKSAEVIQAELDQTFEGK
jgi:hypothetical protein